MRNNVPDLIGAQLVSWVEERARLNEPVIFTNGCFDLFHAGHAISLSEAKAIESGSRLLVALDTDEGVRKLKGDSRPIMPLEYRKMVVRSHWAVDAVTHFTGQDELERCLAVVRPTYLVKGREYEGKPITGSQYAGKVVLLPPLNKAELSVTAIEQKIANESKEKVNLISDLYRQLFRSTESFQSHDIGADLAYLNGAIVTNDQCEWNKHRPFVKLLRKLYSAEHPVWKFVVVKET